MSIEEQRQANKWHIVIAAICCFLCALLVTGVSVAVILHLERAGMQALSEIAIVVCIVLNTLLLAPIFILVRRASKLETLFWQDLAERYGYTYTNRPYFQELALIFQEGKEKATKHGISGVLLDRPFRLFQYSYVIGSGKTRQYHTYCVVEVAFSGTFPHLYLNNTRNRDLSNLKGLFLPRMLLPSELAAKFNLHCPKEYEIEALEIFTPDVLLHLLDADWQHDLELVDQKLYIFREKPMKTKKDFEDEISRVEALLEILAPKLNRMKLEHVGDRRAIL